MPPIIVVDKNIKDKKQISAGARINAEYDIYNDGGNFNKLYSSNLSYIAKNTPLDQRINFFLSLIWIAGVLVIGIYRILIYVHFQRKIKKSLTSMTMG